MKLTHHNQPREELIAQLGTNHTTGLTQAVVTERLTKHGPNKLKEKKKKSTIQRFLDQFKDVMILILIAAAIVSFVLVCL